MMQAVLVMVVEVKADVTPSSWFTDRGMIDP